jgi:hypothetical protein
MKGFKKNIFKTITSEEIPTVPTISILAAQEVDCFGQISLRITTSIPVKVNITGTFSTGGSWLSDTDLTLGGVKVSSDLIGDVVTFRQSYNFGIDGNNIGTIAGTSSVSLEIRDNITNALIDTHVFSRSHTLVQC